MLMKIDVSNSIGFKRKFRTRSIYEVISEPIGTKFEIYNCCKCNEKTLLIYRGRPYCYECICKRKYIIDKLLNKMRGEK